MINWDFYYIINIVEVQIYEWRKEKKEIKIVDGDGTDLDISPVYEDINDLRPKPKDDKPKNIVIPK